jgi:hypothetical protein
VLLGDVYLHHTCSGWKIKYHLIIKGNSIICGQGATGAPENAIQDVQNAIRAVSERKRVTGLFEEICTVGRDSRKFVGGA